MTYRCLDIKTFSQIPLQSAGFGRLRHTKGIIQTALKRTFSPEFLNRIDETGYFSYSVEPGIVTMRFNAEGYAPLVVGPTALKPNQLLDNVGLLLARGFESTIQIVDTDAVLHRDRQFHRRPHRFHRRRHLGRPGHQAGAENASNKAHRGRFRKKLGGYVPPSRSGGTTQAYQATAAASATTVGFRSLSPAASSASAAVASPVTFRDAIACSSRLADQADAYDSAASAAASRLSSRSDSL